MVKPIPDGYHTITPMFIFKNAQKAIDFYKIAFNAKEKYVMPGPNGEGVVHAELLIGNSTFMIGQESPLCESKSAETLGGSPISMYIYVNDVDAAFNQAVKAGAKSQMEVQEMFWGDRMGMVIDPFGYGWAFATHTKDLTPDEISKGAEAAYAQKHVKE